MADATFGVDVWWLPLGAGGQFVKLNGRVYEAVCAWREQRPRAALYHTALTVHVPEGRFVVENAWPIPDDEGASRGVVAEGPVFAKPLGRFWFLRYEIRRWRDGVISDAKWAVGGPQRLPGGVERARRLLRLVPAVPRHVWGRDGNASGDMWNSNSVIAWLLAASGFEMERIAPPLGGRAPGWRSGILEAGRPHDIAAASVSAAGG